MVPSQCPLPGIITQNVSREPCSYPLNCGYTACRRLKHSINSPPPSLDPSTGFVRDQCKTPKVLPMLQHLSQLLSALGTKQKKKRSLSLGNSSCSPSTPNGIRKWLSDNTA
eukprot:TRINITY_DN3314_c0_g4_i1.p1 TRINITY_DN3314_c0_g4~~TRINITY_DN3314_c0_g4_i1.p1  ORF type:complete len:111 (+),score=4.29 TRINITY_DN3314_c0_g4_i1:529-861(+)